MKKDYSNRKTSVIFAKILGNRGKWHLPSCLKPAIYLIQERRIHDYSQDFEEQE